MFYSATACETETKKFSLYCNTAANEVVVVMEKAYNIMWILLRFIQDKLTLYSSGTACKAEALSG